MRYHGGKSRTKQDIFFVHLGRNVLFFTNIIPISLLVTLEVIKYIQVYKCHLI